MFTPFIGTFLTFSDYMRNAIRLCALMKKHVIYQFTHDSIFLGEDGPTHQPIEHAAMLRMTPNMEVWRPANLLETAVAWQQALERHDGPTSLLLSRQNLPALQQTADAFPLIKKGGYIINDCLGKPDAILLSTGSEVHLALAAAAQMQALGKKIRVVSMPCCERFSKQDPAYQEQVLPNAIRKRIAIEAAASTYWYRFVGLDGMVIGIDRFGVSAPAAQAYNYLGLTVDNIVAALKTLFKLTH